MDINKGIPLFSGEAIETRMVDGEKEILETGEIVKGSLWVQDFSPYPAVFHIISLEPCASYHIVDHKSVKQRIGGAWYSLAEVERMIAEKEAMDRGAQAIAARIDKRIFEEYITNALNEGDVITIDHLDGARKALTIGRSVTAGNTVFHETTELKLDILEMIKQAEDEIPQNREEKRYFKKYGKLPERGEINKHERK